jgi:hypothetical protein
MPALPDLPLILCGPMVRRVDPHAAHVFLALLEPCTVHLTVLRDADGRPGTVLMQGSVDTVPLGPHLHVVLARAEAVAPVPWGTACLYTLDFERADGTRSGLHAPGVLAQGTLFSTLDRLTYPGRMLPGFCLPPLDAAEIRLTHGSCRKPHGQGHDALREVDALLETAHGSDAPCPQLLLLTGDQIYADDVHPELLAGLMQVEALLLGRTERDEIAQQGDIRPGRRAVLAQRIAGLTSTAARSHLMTFGEFACMYLMVFAPTLWPISGIDTDGALDGFHDALQHVRRALANVSTLMMFDDHEISDDWNIRQSWIDGVTGSDLGRRIVRNGLTAYAIFQHWGTVPDGPRSVIDAMASHGTSSVPATLDPVLGVTPGLAEGRIDWSWRWQHPTFEIVSLDTRTRRAFDADHYTLATPVDIDLWLRRTDPPPFTVLISPAPVLGVQLIEDVQAAAASISKKAIVAKDFETWAHSTSFNHLINRLLARAPVLILSGDVHYGFVASLVAKAGLYSGERIVNCTASAFKNESPTLVYMPWALGGGRLHAVAGQPQPPTTMERDLTIDTPDGAFVATEEIEGSAVPTPAQLANVGALRPQLRVERRRAPVEAHACVGDIRFMAGRVQQTLWTGEDDPRRDATRFPLRAP